MGLLFAIFGLVFLGFGLIAFFLGASAAWIYGHFGLGVGLLVYSATTNLAEFRELISRDTTRRGVRYGGNVAAQTLIVAVILAFLAYLSVRNPLHADWTEGKVLSLTDATVEALGQISEDQPVEILAFFQQGTEGPAQDILDRYTYANDRVRARVVDPNRHPDLATKHDIRANGILIVCGGPCESASGSARITEATEEELTKAIRSVISVRKKVYFLTGHGEANPEDGEAAGYSRIAEALGAENLEVETLFLAREPGIPDDAAAVILAGPERPLQAREIESLETYLRGGGSVLALVDAFVETNLTDLLTSFGVELGNDVIVDQQIQLFAGPQIGVQPIVVDYGRHPITRKMDARHPTMFNVARSVRQAEGAEGEFVALASSGPSSWAETDTQLFLDEGMVGNGDSDAAGPIALAAAVEIGGESESAGKLVVVGDSDFGRNRYVAEFYNADLFINIVNWLGGEEGFITIERKLPRASRVTMSPTQFNNFRYLSLFVFPEGVLLLGILFWWRRRT
jgi:ABC-type uncharacterized transport system involved in gliding motility auxiliary subunit